jgi:V-type H+-transporting ATPase proteolipid subunit
MSMFQPFAFHRANAQQPKLFVGMILILIFAEALALYGLIGEHGLIGKLSGAARKIACMD